MGEEVQVSLREKMGGEYWGRVLNMIKMKLNWIQGFGAREVDECGVMKMDLCGIWLE